MVLASPASLFAGREQSDATFYKKAAEGGMARSGTWKSWSYIKGMVEDHHRTLRSSKTKPAQAKIRTPKAYRRCDLADFRGAPEEDSVYRGDSRTTSVCIKRGTHARSPDEHLRRRIMTVDRLSDSAR